MRTHELVGLGTPRGASPHSAWRNRCCAQYRLWRVALRLRPWFAPMDPVPVWFRPHEPAGFVTKGITKTADAQYEPKCDLAGTHRRPRGHGDVDSPSFGMGCVDARVQPKAREMCVGPHCGEGTLPACRD